MTNDDNFQERLDAVLPRLRSKDFLESTGLGNEIAFYVFDYPPVHELKVRDEIASVVKKLAGDKPPIKVRHINLFDVLVDHLKERGFLDKVFEMQRTKGDDAVLSPLKGPLDAKRFADVVVAAAKPSEVDLVLVSGVGGVYPLIRTHQLLNNLHPLVPHTPMVFFYPGDYDGKHFRLFGKLQNDNYYRAFKLVS